MRTALSGIFPLDESGVMGYNEVDQHPVILQRQKEESHMKKYVAPEMEITLFEAKDIVTSSNEDEISGAEDD